MSNSRRLAPRPPDEDEQAFRDELRKGCPQCHSRKVTGRFRGSRWEFTLLCEPSCPSHQRPQDGFTGHTIAAAAAQRAGMRYRAFGDGSSTGGVILAAPLSPGARVRRGQR